MRSISEGKRDRVRVRLDASTKRKLERAAAERIIADHEKITLPAPDWDLFHDALLNPPEPNDALRDAVRWYRDRPR